eukprot:jgi/Psemu1/54206/gm1.54206_g
MLRCPICISIRTQRLRRLSKRFFVQASIKSSNQEKPAIDNNSCNSHNKPPPTPSRTKQVIIDVDQQNNENIPVPLDPGPAELKKENKKQWTKLQDAEADVAQLTISLKESNNINKTLTNELAKLKDRYAKALKDKKKTTTKEAADKHKLSKMDNAAFLQTGTERINAVAKTYPNPGVLSSPALWDIHQGQTRSLSILDWKKEGTKKKLATKATKKLFLSLSKGIVMRSNKLNKGHICLKWHSATKVQIAQELVKRINPGYGWKIEVVRDPTANPPPSPPTPEKIGEAASSIPLISQSPLSITALDATTPTETARFGAEFVAGRTCIEQISIDLQQSFRYLGTCVHDLSYLWGDNKKIIQTATFPYARLHKRHHILSYHYVRSMIAKVFVRMLHIPGKDNCADILTKHWGHSVVYSLLKPIFHFCGNTGDLLQDDGNIISTGCSFTRKHGEASTEEEIRLPPKYKDDNHFKQDWFMGIYMQLMTNHCPEWVDKEPTCATNFASMEIPIFSRDTEDMEASAAGPDIQLAQSWESPSDINSKATWDNQSHEHPRFAKSHPPEGLEKILFHQSDAKTTQESSTRADAKM